MNDVFKGESWSAVAIWCHRNFSAKLQIEEFSAKVQTGMNQWALRCRIEVPVEEKEV